MAGLWAVVFGLAAGLAWGAGDYCGGRATSKWAVLPALALAEVSGFVLLLVLALLTREPLPAGDWLWWAIGAGVAGVAGIASIYQGLALGRAATVAPISAVIAVILPVLVSALTDGVPRPLQLAGFVAALLAVWLIAGGSAGSLRRDGLGLAILAGTSFGIYFVLLHHVAQDGVFWPTTVARAVALALVVPLLVLRRPPDAKAAGAVWLGLLAGVVDAGGNAFYVLAGQNGRLDVVAVLSSLYPAATVLLAWLFGGEHIAPRQRYGLVAALAAIAMIST